MKTFFTLLFAIITLSLLSACATPSQIMADAEVRELCEKDGGIKVYETVKLPVERFTKQGSIYIPDKSMSKKGDEYYYKSSTHYLKKGYTDLYRIHTKLYRALDNKLLGEIITYSRRGGDVPGPWHASSFRCPQITDNDLNKQVFIKE